MIKAILALEKKLIPPNLHFNVPNPKSESGSSNHPASAANDDCQFHSKSLVS